MLHDKNTDISKKIRECEFSGCSAKVMKDLHIRRNIYDVKHDVDLYRIFQNEYLIKDILDNTITLPNISPSTWEDNLENPLLNKSFNYDDGTKISLNGLVENSFGLSWTEDFQDEKWRWQYFSHNTSAVRIKVNLYNLLDKLMSIDNVFYSLQYAAVKVSYHDPDDIVKLSKAHYSQFIDSRGQYLTQTLSKLNEKHKDEKEIRIIYKHPDTHERCQWNEKNVKIKLLSQKKLCVHKFEWKNLIQEVVFSPKTPQKYEDEMRKVVKNNNEKCIFKSSIV